MKQRFVLLICIFALATAARSTSAAEPTGPKTAKVLWTYKSSEHFVASPVVGEKALYVQAIGAFNSGITYALSLDPAAKDRILWTKAPPYLKQPVVGPPLVLGDKLIFGDGMHQTDGASLYCINATSGKHLWQLPMAGTLVHLEGTPTTAGGKVFMGGGNAGVFCVDPEKVTLNGKELATSELPALMEAAWKEQLKKYEADKKADPDLAIPPSEDSLPKPAPKVLWHVGRDKWHVDAGVTVAGDRVLAGSALLEDEKIGERAVFCMKAADGSPLWKRPTSYNPWGAPTVAGKKVLVATSSIRFDPSLIAKGKGEVMALDLETGDVLWRNELPASVVSGVLVRGDKAIITTTDKKVRAFKLDDGKDAWTYTAQAPLFAGPAASSDTVYAADLVGGVYAISLADGKRLWKLDLSKAPEVKVNGMVFGTPALADGRLYVTTCNIEATGMVQNAVVCIGEK